MARNPKPYRVTVVRYELDGKRAPKGTPGARKRKLKSKSYYADIPAPNRKRPKRTPLKTSDLGQAWINLRAELRRAAEYAAGIRDRLIDEAERPLSELVDEWGEAVSAGGAEPKYVAQVKREVLALAKQAGWARVNDITEDSAVAALARLQKESGIGPTHRNYHLNHLKQFCRWAVRGGRLKANPVEELRNVPTETDRRHDRRCPTDEEIGKLFGYLYGDGAKVRCGMSGPQRAMGYKVAMATGLRANELRTLGRDSFNLDAATVTVQAAFSKHRKTDVQKLPAWLVAELREWFAAGGDVWSRFPRQFPGRLLQDDLAAAGVEYAIGQRPHPTRPGKLTGGLYFDFHALRHYYVTQVASQPGISPKTLLTLTRHSTPALALKVYAKARQGDVEAAVNSLPPPPVAPPGSPPGPTPGPAPKHPPTPPTSTDRQ